MSNPNKNSRRRLLKAVAGAGGIVTAGKLLPETWTRPVVDAVSLPAHAQMSGEYYDTFTESPPLEETNAGDSLPGGILDLIVPAAHAQVPLIELHMCVTAAGGMARVDLVSPGGGTSGEGGIHLSAMAPIGGGTVPFEVEAVGVDCVQPKEPNTYVQVDSLAKGTVFALSGVWFAFDLPQQACRLPGLAPCEDDLIRGEPLDL